MPSVLKQFQIILTLSVSIFLAACAETTQPPARLPSLPDQPCPSLGDFSTLIDKGEYVTVGKQLDKCLNENSISTKYNGIFSDAYKFMFLLEAASAFSDKKSTFDFIMEKRYLSPLDSELSHIYDSYKKMSESNYNLFKSFMNCVLPRSKDFLPDKCIENHKSALQVSPVKAVYQDIFGEPYTAKLLGLSR